MEYPTNSHKSKQAEEPKKVGKVIKGDVIVKKKTFGKKVMDTFLGENIDSVLSYIIYDILVPAAKGTISDMIKGSIDMMLFGEMRGRRDRDRGGSYVQYDRYYKERDRDRDRDRERYGRSRQNIVRHNFDDIILDSRDEAEDVVSHLVELVDTYGVASVSDLYNLVGISSNFTDDKYGWYNLGGANVSRVRDGYLINLPRVSVLD